jgi:hypothetical protein
MRKEIRIQAGQSANLHQPAGLLRLICVLAPSPTARGRGFTWDQADHALRRIWSLGITVMPWLRSIRRGGVSVSV